MARPKRVTLVDVETFGLHFLDDPILEIGLSLRDFELNEMDRFQSCIWDDPYYQLLKDRHFERDTVVSKMHQDSGLWEDAFETGPPSAEVEQALMDWADDHDINPKEDYLVGSSVYFDSTMMFFNFPRLRERFHHRLIDVSSVKVIAEMWYPNTAARLKVETKPAKKHRVLSDIDDTVMELRWYLNNILPEGDEPNV